jgi:hypothetical protein
LICTNVAPNCEARKGNPKMNGPIRKEWKKIKGAKLFFWRLCYDSGEWIRTTAVLRVMGKDPDSVLFLRRVLQISQTDKP